MKPRAFTLIELLVVIAIIAILSIVVVLTLSPAELLRQGRDATRISDMDTLNRALGLYVTDLSVQGSHLSLGNASTVYVSLVDASSTCGSWGLPALPTGYTYHCSSVSSSRSIDSNGWLPVSLKTITTGSPLGSLPVDPQNQSSSNLYYTYQTDGFTYKLTSFFESQKYAKAMQNGGSDPALYALGANQNLPSVGRGLVGYWPMDEGGSGPATDFSGFSNNPGVWGGTATGTNGYYSAGKIGSWAGAFDGTTTYIGIPAISSTTIGQNGSNITVMAWVFRTGPLNTLAPIIEQGGLRAFRFIISGYRVCFGDDSVTNNFYCSSNTISNLSSWYFIAASYDGSFYHVFINGSEVAINQSVGSYGPWATTQLNIGYRPYTVSVSPWNGLIDDVRVYDRMLTASEIQQIYNAEK